MNSVNDAPVANNDVASTNEDTSVVIEVPSNDTDLDGVVDVTSVTIIDAPTNGTVSVDALTGFITYTPNAGFFGVDSLVYSICDDGEPSPVLCDTALVIINVNPCLSNPQFDCDGDGVTNGDEFIDNTDPLDPCDYNVESITLPQSDMWLNADCDSDGISNEEEALNGSDPFDPCDPYPSLPSCITDIFIPQAVTPNGDGYNDYFEILGLENYPDNHVTIFNRWGSIVFDTDGYNNDWEGVSIANMAFGGELLPTGTYFYILELKENGKTFKGYVYLQR